MQCEFKSRLKIIFIFGLAVLQMKMVFVPFCFLSSKKKRTRNKNQRQKMPFVKRTNGRLRSEPQQSKWNIISWPWSSKYAWCECDECETLYGLCCNHKHAN